MSQLGALLRSAREERSLTQMQVAVAAKLDPSTVSAVELGKSAPSFDVVARIASVLDVSLDALAGRPRTRRRRAS